MSRYMPSNEALGELIKVIVPRCVTWIEMEHSCIRPDVTYLDNWTLYIAVSFYSGYTHWRLTVSKVRDVRSAVIPMTQSLMSHQSHNSFLFVKALDYSVWFSLPYITSELLVAKIDSIRLGILIRPINYHA